MPWAVEVSADLSGRRLGADQDQGGADLGDVCASGARGWWLRQPKLALLCRGGLWSAGSVPGDGLLHRVAVRGGLEAAEGGFEFGGVDDEGRAELGGRPGPLAGQRGGG